jgi:hypothetical protein
MLPLQQVVQQLSLTEWAILCSKVDTCRPEREVMARHGDGSDVQRTAGGKIARRFDVIEIKRLMKAVQVVVDVEGEEKHLRFEVTKAA